MFSSITIASSTTKPTAMVSAISDRLSGCSPAGTSPPAVPSSASGTVMLGITVAGTLRRNTKMTITTSAMVSISVNSTSASEARMFCVRSASTLTLTAAGIELQAGQGGRMRSTVSITLAPGCLVTARMIARPLWNVLSAGRRRRRRPSPRLFSGPSTATPTSRTRTGRRCARPAPCRSRRRAGDLVVGVDVEGLVAPSVAPVGWLTVVAAITPRMSSRLRPIDASLAGSTWMRTAGFCWPNVDQADAVDLRDLLRQDVVGVVVDGGQRQRVGLHRQHQDGASAGLILRNVGGRQVGRQLAARGVDGGLHVQRGGVDVAVQVELQRDLRLPCALVDVICARPAISENWRSSGCATFDAIVSGLAPGRLAVTWMVGKSTCGSEATAAAATPPAPPAATPAPAARCRWRR
jgi:hypothetical protein